MIKAHVNGEDEFSLEVEGNITKLTCEVISICHGIYSGIKKSNPKTAESFKKMVTTNMPFAFVNSEGIEEEMKQKREEIIEDAAKKKELKKLANEFAESAKKLLKLCD